MRKLAIAMALASTTLATPAFARDNSPYVGLEAGVSWFEDLDLDFDDTGGVEILDEAISIHHNSGYDIDVIGGYDFGMVRAEAELAYKRNGLDSVTVDPAITGLALNGPFELDGHASVLSGMVNVMFDFGDDDGWSAYVGPGIGMAKVKYHLDVNDDAFDVDPDDFDFVDDSDSGFAWQLIAGVRAAITPNLDLGLKYRYFNVRSIDLGG
jgi:OOP family OmpA-OmpF porin